MFNKLLLLLFLIQVSLLHAQFSFSGEVNEEFKESTVYLNQVDDYDTSSLFLTENILLETEIDSLNRFSFSGDFLDDSNRLYKIYIDNCNENVNSYKHINEHCDLSRSVLFVANNTDSIQFPLNDLAQIFCAMEYTKESNFALSKIDSLEEYILLDLQNLINSKQRNFIYKKYLTSLQDYSTSFDEPLVELYAHYLYSNDKSLSKSYYQSDLQHSNYYLDLLNRLKAKYPNTKYYKYYKRKLEKEAYPFLEKTKKGTNYYLYLVSFILLLSMLINIYLWRKMHRLQNKQIAYKDVLTSQEQKVFNLMHLNKSNKEIATALFVSLSTVKTHINNIYSKLSISSRTEIDKFF